MRLLTDEQKERAKQLREEYREQFQALREQREGGEMTPEAFRKEAKALREQARSDMRDLLTDEQKAKLKSWREQHAERRQEAQAVRAEVLDLSADQQEALRQLREEQRAARRELFRQLRNGDRGALRDAMNELRTQRRAQTEAVLDDRQMEIIVLHRALVGRTLRHTARHHRQAD